MKGSKNKYSFTVTRPRAGANIMNNGGRRLHGLVVIMSCLDARTLCNVTWAKLRITNIHRCNENALHGKQTPYECKPRRCCGTIPPAPAAQVMSATFIGIGAARPYAYWV